MSDELDLSFEAVTAILMWFDLSYPRESKVVEAVQDEVSEQGCFCHETRT